MCQKLLGTAGAGDPNPGVHYPRAVSFLGVEMLSWEYLLLTQSRTQHSVAGTWAMLSKWLTSKVAFSIVRQYH
jgi:hypothetical protein